MCSGFYADFISGEFPACPQQSPESVNIEVHFDQPQGTISPIWNYFGYDEPNYTYAPNGRNCWESWPHSAHRARLC